MKRMLVLFTSLTLIALGNISAQSKSISKNENNNSIHLPPLLRHGQLTPRPSNYNEAALQLGSFNDTIRKLGEGNVNKVFTGTLNFGPDKIKVVIKPDIGLLDKSIRSDISRFNDNASSDGAFHLNKKLIMIRTPEHIIRDDVPILRKEQIIEGTKEFVTSLKGSAGVQVYNEFEKITSQIESQIQSDPILLKELEEAAIFDCIIGNTDRHRKNWGFISNPGNGKRHILLIDHSLCFPSEKDRSFGNYDLLELYLNSSMEGKISASNLVKLRNLRYDRTNINAKLKLNISQDKVDLLWDRLNKMLIYEKVFYP